MSPTFKPPVGLSFSTKEVKELISNTTKSPSRTCGNTGAGGASYFYQTLDYLISALSDTNKTQ